MQMKMAVFLAMTSSMVTAFQAPGSNLAGMRAPRIDHRDPPQMMVVGKVRNFISTRLISPFRRTPEAEAEEDIGVTMVAEKLEVPAPVVLDDKKNLTAVDALLVKLGVKTEEECVLPEEGENLMEQIKCAGRAGIISYILWEWAFWIGAGGIAAITYYQATGGWPDLSNPDDQAKVGASAFALVNVARFAVPLRIGLALGSTPWVDDNIVKPFLGGDDDDDGNDQGEGEAKTASA
jgi:hypothetical protein